MTFIERSAAKGIRTKIAWRLYFISGAIFATVGLYLPYFPVWLAASGLGDREIAFVTGAPFIARILVTPLVSHFADRRGIALALGLCAGVMLLGYSVLGFAVGFWPIFLATLLAITTQGAMPALLDALSLSEIRRVGRISPRPVHYGRIRMGASLSALIVMALSGWIVAIFPGEKIIEAIIILAVISATAALWASLSVRKVRFDRSASGSLTENPQDLKRAIMIIAAGSLIQASHAEIYSFGTLLWKGDELSAGFIGTAWALGVAFESLFFFSAERLFGSSRASVFLMMGGLGAVLRWCAMGLHPSAAIMLMLQAAHALTFASTYLGTVLLLGQIAGRNHRARIQGWYATASSLLMAFSTMACGWLTSHFGVQAYFGMALLAACGLGFAMRCAFAHPQSAGVGG